MHCACVKMTSHVGKHETSYSISKLSAKFQFWAIHTADNTDGKVTGCGQKNTGQVGDKSTRRHPTRRQVDSATANSVTTAVNSATTSVKSATFANRLGDNFGHIGDKFWLNPDLVFRCS